MDRGTIKMLANTLLKGTINRRLANEPPLSVAFYHKCETCASGGITNQGTVQHTNAQHSAYPHACCQGCALTNNPKMTVVRVLYPKRDTASKKKTPVPKTAHSGNGQMTAFDREASQRLSVDREAFLFKHHRRSTSVL